jgi:hypothetical protein
MRKGLEACKRAAALDSTWHGFSKALVVSPPHWAPCSCESFQHAIPRCKTRCVLAAGGAMVPFINLHAGTCHSGQFKMPSFSELLLSGDVIELSNHALFRLQLDAGPIPNLS